MNRFKKKKNISVFLITLDIGGAERFVSLILPKLVKDYNVHLVLFYNVVHFTIPKEVQVHFLVKNNLKNIFQKIFLFPLLVYRYFCFIKKNNIDISLSLLPRPNIINCFIKIFNKKPKVIISERNFASIIYKSNKLRFYFYKIVLPLFYNKADILFSNSFHINEDLENNFKINIPKCVIYNPVELNQKEVFPERSCSKDFKIINVGSLYYIKNQMLLIKAFQTMRINGTLSFLGHGVDKAKISDYITKNNLDDKIFLKGKVKDVSKYLNESDCFVLTSDSEGFPNALLEAMAVGLPVISTNCLSGPLEILNENVAVDIQNGEFFLAKYGILINVDDVEALRMAILSLYNDLDSRIKYSNLAYERAKEFDIDNIYIELNKLFK